MPLDMFDVVTQALQRTCSQALAAAQLDSRLETMILTAVPYPIQLHDFGVRVEAAPTHFNPPKAKYKARNLEYCRKILKLQDNDWVLHLDEDSLIDINSLRACVDFIECERYEFGQVSTLGLTVCSSKRQDYLILEYLID